MPAAEPYRFAIFASGNGSNTMALMDHFENGFLPATLALVFCNQNDAPVLDKAKSRGYTVACLPHQGLTRQAHEQAILDILAQHHIDHILLAGYMRILSKYFLQHFNGSVLNIHPALLPEFRGINAVEQQWQAGVKVAGATVHCVTEQLDDGPILLQDSLIVRGDENVTTLTERIQHEIEHQLYPRAVRVFLERLERESAKEVTQDDH